MGSEKLPAVVNHNHSQEVKPYHKANLIDTTFYITKIIQVAVCIFLTQQILSYFQKTYNEFIKEPKCMNVFL